MPVLHVPSDSSIWHVCRRDSLPCSPAARHDGAGMLYQCTCTCHAGAACTVMQSESAFRRWQLHCHLGCWPLWPGPRHLLAPARPSSPIEHAGNLLQTWQLSRLCCLMRCAILMPARSSCMQQSEPQANGCFCCKLASGQQGTVSTPSGPVLFTARVRTHHLSD